jgi:hypothetical protein
VLTVQTPYKDEDYEALTDRLYVCPQARPGPHEPRAHARTHARKQACTLARA